MEHSESIKSISKALETFRQAVNPITKDAKNPFFKSSYATLGNILDSIKEPLKISGLTFSQHPDGDGLTTILMHTESGEYLASTFNIRPVKDDPQALGSAITYARRYALSAILGLNTDADDDGEGAMKRPAPVKASTWPPVVKEKKTVVVDDSGNLPF